MERKFSRRILLLITVSVLTLLMAGAVFAAEPGWHKQGKKITYYVTSETGQTVGAQGLVKVGSYYYWFEKGVMKTGWVYTPEGLRYFRKKGKLGSKLGAMFIDTVVKFDGKYYGFNEKGIVLTGFRKVNGHYYYFYNNKKAGKKGAAARKKWIKVKGFTRYFASNGRMQRNKWIGKKYLDKNGCLLKNTITPDGYVVGSDGSKLKKANGWTKVGSKKVYYSASQKKILTNTFVQGKSHIWYVGSDGTAIRGWAVINGSRYYFNSKGYRVKGLVTISGKKYYFSNDGVLLTNTTINGYTVDSNGVAVKISSPVPSNGKKTILIDAGHGQGDIGATSSMGYKEYLYTRQFAKLIYQKLQASGRVNVEFYKDGSVNYDLFQQNRKATAGLEEGVAGSSKNEVRAALASNPNCPDLTRYDYILEVHFNATGYNNKDVKGDGKYKGIGFYYNGTYGKSTAMERRILNSIHGLGFNIWAGAPVVSNTLLNAKICAKLGVNYALLETAFIDDKDDMSFYFKNKDEMAQRIADQILAYYG